MTVSSTTFYTDWSAANGAITEWSYDFQIDLSSEVQVLIRDGTDDTTIEVFTDNLTLVPTGDGDEGYVIYPASGDPVPTGKQVRIRRIVALTQTTEIGNEGDFRPQIHEKAFDKLTKACQQINGLFASTITVIGNNAGYEMAGALEDGRVLIYSAGLIQSGPNAGDITSAQEYAQQAKDARDLAQKWAENPEDVTVDGVGTYSSLHYSAKAEGWATDAGEAAELAADWAESPDEVEPGKRSAKYWAEIADAIVNLPIGTVIDVYGDGSTPVPGYLLCNGAPVTAAYPALRAFGLANGWPIDGNGDPLLPDSGGRVKRGWFSGQTIDSGRVFGTTQEDQMQQLTGDIGSRANTAGTDGALFPPSNGALSLESDVGATAAGISLGTTQLTDKLRFNSANSPGARVGDETRMHNYTVTQWIKAYDVAQTDTTGMDLAEIANDISAVQVEVTNLPFHKFYESAEQTITAAGLLTLAHGLGVAPKLLQALIVCKTAEGGYSVGDVVALGPVDITGSTGTARGYSAKINSTNIVIRFGSTANTVLILHGTDGGGFGVTNANWRFIMRAWA